MKKMLAVLLVISVLFSLAALNACTKAEEPVATGAPAASDTPAPAAAPTEAPVVTEAPAEEITEEMLKNSKPNEYVQEKLDAGMKPLVTFVTATLTSDFVVNIDKGFKKAFEALGYSYATGNANNDPSQMLTQVENAVEMKSAAVLILALIEGLADISAKAKEVGTHIILFGNTAEFPVAGTLVLDQKEQGKQGAYMVHAWLDLVYPNAEDGSVHAFITLNFSQPQNVARSEAYKEYLPMDPRITLSYEGTHIALSSDEGYTFAQNAFTVDPEIRVGLLFNSSGTVGANNYFIANVPASELPKYGLFCNTQDKALVELIKAGATNEGSCIRGTIGQGGAEGAWVGPYKCAIALLTGGAEYGYIEYDRMYAINNFGYVYDTEI